MADNIDETIKKLKGLPIKVTTNGESDPEEERRLSKNNFDEGLRQRREDEGKKINEERKAISLPEDDFSEGYPYQDEKLPRGPSARNKAKIKLKEENRGFAKGGMVRGYGCAVKGRGKGTMY